MDAAPPIADEALAPGDIPGPEASWAEIASFALQFDGYSRLGSFGACAETGNRARETFSRERSLPADLVTARTALFFEQRRYHHLGEPPAAGEMAYLHALIERIRELVNARRG